MLGLVCVPKRKATSLPVENRRKQKTLYPPPTLPIESEGRCMIICLTYMPIVI